MHPLKNSIILIAILTLFTLCFSGCLRILGIHKIKEIETTELTTIAKKWNIQEPLYQINQEKFKEIYKHYPFISDSLQQLMQPLQVIVFDPAGKRISHLINCNFPSTPYPKWNYEGALDSFPLLSSSTSLIHHEVTLEEILFYIDSERLSNNVAGNNEKNVYTYFVFVPKFMPKYASKLIQLVKNHLKAHEKNAEVHYVLTDNLYIN